MDQFSTPSAAQRGTENIEAWRFDGGAVRDAAGRVIAIVAVTLPDSERVHIGRLLANAPALLANVQLSEALLGDLQAERHVPAEELDADTHCSHCEMEAARQTLQKTLAQVAP